MGPANIWPECPQWGRKPIGSFQIAGVGKQTLTGPH